MHEHDTGDRAVEPDHVEEARNVEVDRDARKRLWQQQGQQDEATPRQTTAAKRIAGRDREEEADDNRDRRDQNAGAERGESIAGRLKYLTPVAEAVGKWQSVGVVPLDGKRPQQKIGERPENREGQKAEHAGAPQPSECQRHPADWPATLCRT